MSFEFEWPRFSQEFYATAAQELTRALNKSEKPPNIARDIVVTDLDLGTVAPDLEILEVVELSHDGGRFRGIFRLSYAGDAFITLQTAVQANPIVDGQPLSVGSAFAGAGAMGMPAMVAANSPLIVPLQLKIAKLQLAGIASLVVDKYKGITLAFKNDPLEKVTVSSTFDHMATIRRFLQSEIEKLLRKLFLEDIPAIVHNASLVHLQQTSSASSSNLSHADSTTQPTPPPAAWIEPRTGQPLLDEPLELEHDELVRLAKAIHQPPSSSARAPSPGLATLLLSTLANVSPSKFASSSSSASASSSAAHAPSATTPPMRRRDGLATVIDSDSDSDLTKPAPASPASSSSPTSSGPADPYTPLASPLPPAIDPRDDPGTLFGALGLLLPEWTSAPKTPPPAPARVHRFNPRYYAKYKQPASVLYAASLSAPASDAGSAVSLPAVLPSQQGVGGAGPSGLHRSHSHLLVSASGSAGGSRRASGTSSASGAPGALARARSASSTGLGRRGLGPIRSMSSTASRESATAADASSSTSESTNGGGGGGRSGGAMAGNAFAAQLANLYSANQSLSPFARHTEHSMFRSLPKRKQPAGQHHAEHAGRGPDEFGLPRANSSLMSIPSGTIITPAVSPTSSSGPGMSGALGYVTPRMVARRSRKAVRKRVFTVDLRAKPVEQVDVTSGGEEEGVDEEDELSPSSSVSVVGAQAAAGGAVDEDWAARFTDELLPSSSVSEVGVVRGGDGGGHGQGQSRRRVSRVNL